MSKSVLYMSMSVDGFSRIPGPRARLGLEVEVLRGGHLIALSHPRGLAERLIAYSRENAATAS